MKFRATLPSALPNAYEENKIEKIAERLKKVKETKGYLRDDSLDPEHPGIKNLQKILDDLLKERKGTDKAEPDTDEADPNPPFDRAPGPAEAVRRHP